MIIGNEFIEVFAEEARKLDGIEFLAQGTIWPDILESEEGIKAHHNAGGLPEDMNFELVEPVLGGGGSCRGSARRRRRLPRRSPLHMMPYFT